MFFHISTCFFIVGIDVQELQGRVSAALLRRHLGRPVVPSRRGLRAAPAGRQWQLGLAHRGRKTQTLRDPLADVARFGRETRTENSAWMGIIEMGMVSPRTPVLHK